METTREEMIAKIYEEIADKTLRRWCIIHDYNHRENDDKIEVFNVVHYEPKNTGVNLLYYNVEYSKWYWQSIAVHHLFWEKMDYRFKWKNEWELRYKIIGHPVMIWDVYDYHEKDCQWYLMNMWQEDMLQRQWLEKRKPIEEQSDECIDFVFSLL